MTLNRDPGALNNRMHVGLARAFKITRLSDFEAGILAKGHVTREDYEEAHRRYVERMTAAGFIVDEVIDNRGLFVRNYSSSRRDELFTRGGPAEEVARMDAEERAIAQECEGGTFQLISAIFWEQSKPSSQFDK
jgi:hypothetical protein